LGSTLRALSEALKKAHLTPVPGKVMFDTVEETHGIQYNKFKTVFSLSMESDAAVYDKGSQA
jgi:hypothetical protein